VCLRGVWCDACYTCLLMRTETDGYCAWCAACGVMYAIRVC
jgi:hypothetical protein